MYIWCSLLVTVKIVKGRGIFFYFFYIKWHHVARIFKLFEQPSETLQGTSLLYVLVPQPLKLYPVQQPFGSVSVVHVLVIQGVWQLQQKGVCFL